MTISSSQPSLEQLKQAVEIAEKIARLESELGALLSGTSSPAAPTPRGRRPKAVPAAKYKKFVDDEAAVEKPARKKRVMSPEGRRRIIEAQKKRWAAKKKQG
ncbi:MAG: hypothetical protein ACAI34_25905 [Verrucomicrobium sp.]|nr:hypothetical protein [Verrucomicrobium sp.]